jgi:predicted dehydrogenase
MIGASPIDVQASAISTDDARVTSEDSVSVNIRYDDGSVAAIQYVSLGANTLAKERAEVFADGRVAVMDDFCTTTFHGGEKRAPLKTKQAKGFDEELAAFIDAIRDANLPAPISFASLVRTSRLTFAIRESISRGKPVSLAPESTVPTEATV